MIRFNFVLLKTKLGSRSDGQQWYSPANVLFGICESACKQEEAQQAMMSHSLSHKCAPSAPFPSSTSDTLSQQRVVITYTLPQYSNL